MKTTHSFASLALLAPLLLSCADRAAPPLPSLGIQIDRMGRAGVNTAVTDPFNPDNTLHGKRQDDYNVASNPSQWGGLFSAEMAGNLAILDALDGVCGNQPLAKATVAADRYLPLAGVLADDKLYVNSASGSCGVYLAVEANATGLIPNGDCGGRTPLENTIDVTYSFLALGNVQGVTNGVTIDADGNHSLTQFPFLDKPL